MKLNALILDFDGLLLETEEAQFQSWAETFVQYGVELTIEEWASSIGTVNDLDPMDELARRAGSPLDRDNIRKTRRARRDELLGTLSESAGVRDLIAQADELGLKLAVASSSPTSWVDTHLTRLGLRDRFRHLACFDGEGSPKPAPDLYRVALRSIDVTPEECLAFEDSHNGLQAAKAAGLRCVVVPTAMTAHMDFTLADLVVPRLDDPSLKTLLVDLTRDCSEFG